MRIIYGVSGEGSGHSSRAKEMTAHLLGRCHEVKLVSYNRGFRSLRENFDCMEISGLHIVSVDNKVSILKTLIHNVSILPACIRSVRKLRTLFSEFQPDCVISDFEPMTAYLASVRKIPLISLDNQHRMRYMHFEVPARLRLDQWITQMVIRLMVPRPDVSLATTFFQDKVKNTRTFLFPPILRKEIGAVTPSHGDYHLVYLTSGYDTLLCALRQLSHERFVVYGYDKAEQDGNLEFKTYSSSGFLNDLAGCRSVMATAGFTLISEAMYLQKPYLAFPMHGQFEQQLNGLCLEQLGYGTNALAADVTTLREFLARLPEFAAALQHYENGFSTNPAAVTNAAICERLDKLLADDGMELRQFHTARAQ